MRQNFTPPLHSLWVTGLVVGAFVSAPALAADYFIDASYPRTAAVNDGSDYVQINFKIQSFKCNEPNSDGSYTYASSSSISCPNDGAEGSSIVPRYGVSIYPQTQLEDSFFDRSFYSSDFSGIFRVYIRSTVLGDPAPSLYRDSDHTQLALGPLEDKVSFHLPLTPTPMPSPTPFISNVSTQTDQTAANPAPAPRSTAKPTSRNVLGTSTAISGVNTVLGSATERFGEPQLAQEAPITKAFTEANHQAKLIPLLLAGVLAGMVAIICIAFYWRKRRSQ